MNELKRGDSDGSMLNDFRIEFSFPKDFGIRDASDTIAEVEGFLDARREKYGIETMRVWFRSTYGSIHVFLKKTNECSTLLGYRIKSNYISRN